MATAHVVVPVTALEGGKDAEGEKKELLDDTQRPTFENDRAERFFWYSMGQFVAFVGIVIAILIGVGVIGIGDGTQSVHITVRWVAFAIVLSFSLLVLVTMLFLMVRELSAVRAQRENAMLEEEMQEGVVATEKYQRMPADDANEKKSTKKGGGAGVPQK